MFALLAYTVATLFVGITVFGHVLLFRTFSQPGHRSRRRGILRRRQQLQIWRKAA